MSAEVISKELDYSSPVNNHSTVIYRSVAPQGSSSVTTSVTSSIGPVTFIIPPAPFNFSKSKINFTLDLAAGGAGNFNYVNGNLLTAIQRITLYDSATNALWCDISNIPSYAGAVIPSTTSFDEYVSKSFKSGAVQVTVANARTVSVEDIVKSNKSTNNQNGINVDIAPENPFFSRRQFYIGAANAKTCIDVSIPLSAFKMSILSSDKLYYTPSNLTMDVYFSANNDYSFLATSATDPTDNVASLGTAIAISNLSLSLAGEANLAITSKLIDTVMTKGLSLPFAYPTVTRQVLAGATSQSYQLSITKGYGSRILAFYTVPYENGAVNVRNVHYRHDITQYNTFLNNVPIKRPQGFDCLASEDYMLANKALLDKSVIQTLGEYILAEWVHIDAYTGERPMHTVDQHQVDGLDIGSSPATWSIQVSQANATALNYTTVIVGQKILSISSQGSTVM